MTDLTTLAGRRLWIGIPGPTVEDSTRALLEEVRPGGVVLFRRNVRSLDQVRELIAALHEVLGSELLISVDHEGGLVTRFHQELTVFPGNMALGAVAYREPSMGEHLAEEQGELSARELRDLGIHVNIAPVLDLATRGDNPGITIRSFGAPPELVEKLGVAIVKGTLRGGVHPVLKHFPGKGDATVDAHLDLPVIDDTSDQAPHLRPFQHGLKAGARIVMTSHVIYRAMDSERPATLSSAVVTDLLRGDLGFDGIVVTDDLEMGAMQKHYGFEAAIRDASSAGHDVFCIAHDPELHHRAGQLLREGAQSGAEWFGDPTEITARLDSVCVLPATTAPDPVHARTVANAIAGRAVTVVRDDRDLIPIPAGVRCVVALPTLRAETGVENPLRGEEDASAFAETLEAAGLDLEIVQLGTEPTSGEVDALLARAGSAARLLVVTTNARFLDAQRLYAQRCLTAHDGAILVPIRNPFDAEVRPPDVPASIVVSYGFRPPQLRALGRVLTGEIASYGCLPIELNPL